MGSKNKIKDSASIPFWQREHFFDCFTIRSVFKGAFKKVCQSLSIKAAKRLQILEALSNTTLVHPDACMFVSYCNRETKMLLLSLPAKKLLAGSSRCIIGSFLCMFRSVLFGAQMKSHCFQRFFLDMEQAKCTMICETKIIQYVTKAFPIFFKKKNTLKLIYTRIHTWTHCSRGQFNGTKMFTNRFCQSWLRLLLWRRLFVDFATSSARATASISSKSFTPKIISKQTHTYTSEVLTLLACASTSHGVVEWRQVWQHSPQKQVSLVCFDTNCKI